MTNWEYAVSKGLIEEGYPLCVVANICKYGSVCETKSCPKCEFNHDVSLCIQTLLQEHKEAIRLKQWEYDLLKTNLECYGDELFCWYTDVRKMKEKGYFKGVTDTSMTLKEILDDCEVVEDE